VTAVAPTDDEFLARLHAAQDRLVPSGADSPEQRDLDAACAALDELSSDPAVLANERWVARLRQAVEWVYREAWGWEFELPAGWSERQVARVGAMPQAEFEAREDAFAARLDAVTEPVDRRRNEPPAPQEAYDLAFEALDELLSDPTVESNEAWRSSVSRVAEQLHRMATSAKVRLPSWWEAAD